MASPLQKTAVNRDELAAHGAVAEAINFLNAPHPRHRNPPAAA
jgi:hypothetical protein